MAPGLVDAAVIHSSSSSWEPDNYLLWGGLDDSHYGAAARTHGTPETNPAAWRAVSSRTYADRITAPVLIQHGALDSECDPEWARATHTHLTDSAVSARLEMYEGQGHTFDARFNEVMDDTLRFLQSHLI